MRICYALTIHAANKWLVLLPIYLASSPPGALNLALESPSCSVSLYHVLVFMLQMKIELHSRVFKKSSLLLPHFGGSGLKVPNQVLTRVMRSSAWSFKMKVKEKLMAEETCLDGRPCWRPHNLQPIHRLTCKARVSKGGSGSREVEKMVPPGSIHEWRRFIVSGWHVAMSGISEEDVDVHPLDKVEATRRTLSARRHLKP